MSILIRKPGILSTVQDLGRTGSRRFGVNPNGVMDTTAARLTNLALGNDENAAMIEMHFPAAEIEFEHDTIFALGGADLGAELDGVPVSVWRTRLASKGSFLKFVGRSAGNRAYVAVKGGFEVEKWLGSSSTNLMANAGGVEGRKLAIEDRIECAPSCDLKQLKIGCSLIPRYSRFPTVRFTAGAEYGMLTAISERALVNGSFKVTAESNRMGFRLQGEPLHLLHQNEMLSSAVDFGTIQLLPDGQMIILMADHQTSGGYPRIAHIVKQDLPIVAQLGPNDALSFHLVNNVEAEQISLRFEREVAFFKTGIKLEMFG